MQVSTHTDFYLASSASHEHSHALPKKDPPKTTKEKIPFIPALNVSQCYMCRLQNYQSFIQFDLLFETGPQHKNQRKEGHLRENVEVKKTNKHYWIQIALKCISQRASDILTAAMFTTLYIFYHARCLNNRASVIIHYLLVCQNVWLKHL